MSLTVRRGHSLASRTLLSPIHCSTSQEVVALFFDRQQLFGLDMRRKIMNVSSAKWTVQVASSSCFLSWCFFPPAVRERLDIIKPCNMCPFCPVPRKAIKRCLSNLFYLEINVFFTTFAMRDPITEWSLQALFLFNNQGSNSKTLAFALGKGKRNWDSEKCLGTAG